MNNRTTRSPKPDRVIINRVVARIAEIRAFKESNPNTVLWEVKDRTFIFHGPMHGFVEAIAELYELSVDDFIATSFNEFLIRSTCEEESDGILPFDESRVDEYLKELDEQEGK